MKKNMLTALVNRSNNKITYQYSFVLHWCSPTSEIIQCMIHLLFSTSLCTGTVSEKFIASIFYTSVVFNYLGHSIGGSHNPFVSILIHKVLVTNYFSPSIGGSDEAMYIFCTSYDLNIIMHRVQEAPSTLQTLRF